LQKWKLIPVFLLGLGVMCALAVLYTQPSMFQGFNICDEGIIAYGAARVMGGDIPY